MDKLDLKIAETISMFCGAFIRFHENGLISDQELDDLLELVDSLGDDDYLLKSAEFDRKYGGVESVK